MKKVRVRKFWIPIFCILFIIYSIMKGLPEGWLWWAIVAFVLDCFVNPIYAEAIEIEEPI